jgi:GNAT superfamily N-acetyltransferase
MVAAAGTAAKFTTRSTTTTSCYSPAASSSSSSSVAASQLGGSIRYDRLTAADATEAAGLFGNAFPLSAPHSWGRALGLTTGIDGFMKGYMPEHINNMDLGCFGARRSSDNKLVGAVILEFMSAPIADDKKKPEVTPQTIAEEEDNAMDPKLLFAYRAIDGIMKECKYIFERELTNRHCRLDSKCGYVAWIAVDESSRGVGIAGELIKRGTTLLRDSGCRYSVAFTVSPIATKAFEKAGYAKWGSVTYKEYELDGKYPFSILPDEVSVMVSDDQR